MNIQNNQNKIYMSIDSFICHTIKDRKKDSNILKLREIIGYIKALYINQMIDTNQMKYYVNYVHSLLG